MKKIFNFIRNTSIKMGVYFNLHFDKVIHFLLGVLICGISSIFLTSLFSFILASFSGVLKEVSDYYISGSIDYFDLLCTIGGALFILIILII